jgi:hypothetical protein
MSDGSDMSSDANGAAVSEDESLYRERREALRRELGPESLSEDAPDWVVDAIEWVRAKWGDDPICPYCGNNQWNVMGLTELESSPDDPQVPEGAVFPLFQVACTSCGHTVLVNARVSGVVSPTEDVEAE